LQAACHVHWHVRQDRKKTKDSLSARTPVHARSCAGSCNRFDLSCGLGAPRAISPVLARFMAATRSCSHAPGLSAFVCHASIFLFHNVPRKAGNGEPWHAVVWLGYDRGQIRAKMMVWTLGLRPRRRALGSRLACLPSLLVSCFLFPLAAKCPKHPKWPRSRPKPSSSIH